MSYLFPRVTYGPMRCAPANRSFAPIFSLFENVSREFQASQRASRPIKRPFNARFDVKEEKESYVLEGEVPGFKQAEISIEWKDDTLAIGGRHETASKSGKKPEVDAEGWEAVNEATASESGSVKSHQATVEDEEGAAASASNSADQETATKPAEPALTADKTSGIQHLISERSQGAFLRQFTFPANAVRPEAITASLEAGILRIVVPKAPQQPSRRINIE